MVPLFGGAGVAEPFVPSLPFRCKELAAFVLSVLVYMFVCPEMWIAGCLNAFMGGISKERLKFCGDALSELCCGIFGWKVTFIPLRTRLSLGILFVIVYL